MYHSLCGGGGVWRGVEGVEGGGGGGGERGEGRLWDTLTHLIC